MRYLAHVAIGSELGEAQMSDELHNVLRMAQWSKREQRKYLNYGAPGGTRTPGPLVRSQALA
jgi:hypothetical protein